MKRITISEKPSIPELYTDPNWEERTFMYRGKVIAHFAIFEKSIESFLAAEFATARNDVFTMRAIIFDRMTFESKRTSVRTVLNNRDADTGLIKSKSNPNKKFLDELSALNQIRNQFAHFVNVQAINKEEYSYAIGLRDERDSPTTIWFTPEDIELIIKRILSAKLKIIKLQKKEF